MTRRNRYSALQYCATDRLDAIVDLEKKMLIGFEFNTSREQDLFGHIAHHN